MGTAAHSLRSHRPYWISCGLTVEQVRESGKVGHYSLQSPVSFAVAGLGAIDTTRPVQMSRGNPRDAGFLHGGKRARPTDASTFIVLGMNRILEEFDDDGYRHEIGQQPRLLMTDNYVLAHKPIPFEPPLKSQKVEERRPPSRPLKSGLRAAWLRRALNLGSHFST